MEEVVMIERSQEKDLKEFEQQNRGKMEVEYYRGSSEEVSGEQEDTNIPYKLEPNNSTEIEDFLARLRQEGL